MSHLKVLLSALPRMWILPQIADFINLDGGEAEKQGTHQIKEGDEASKSSPSAFTGLTEDSLNQGKFFRMMGR